jgi:hypothetical protein
VNDLPASVSLFSSSQLLAGLAALLLVFVSGGVIYLSTVEWRDRRRRAATAGRGTVVASPRRRKKAGAKSSP